MGRPSRKDKAVVPDYSEGIETKTEDDDLRFNNSLARGLAIIRAFQIDRQLLGNLELAELTGLPKSTISRLTFTLMQLGYLCYREPFGKYELAAGVVGLAYPYLANQPVPPIARPLMAALAKKSGTNVGLGVREGLSVLYLEYAQGVVQAARPQRAGFRIPLVRTATGRACIAAMRADEREKLFERLQPAYGSHWRKLKGQLQDAVAQVDDRGYCIAAGTFSSGTHAVATPFVYDDGRTLLAFNSQGRAQDLSPAVLARNGKRLVELAWEVRRLLALSTPTPSLGRQ